MWTHSLWFGMDPLPVPPATYGTTAWWRWWTALTLAARKETA